MARPLVVFEDAGFSNLFPLTLTRPVFDLVCGMSSLAGKVVAGAGGWATGGSPAIHFHARDYLAPVCDGAVTSYRNLFTGQEVLTLVNGRAVFDAGVVERIDTSWPGRYVCCGSTAIANVSAGLADELDRNIGRPLTEDVFKSLPSRSLDIGLVSFPWDLVELNPEEIGRDFASAGGGRLETEPAPLVHVVEPGNVRIGKNVRMSPGVVIDASGGPVSIDDDVVVMANASLAGPLHIGSGSIIKMGAKIYGGTTIGPVSKIGGEVAETIIQGYTNKQHEGFLGHSYIGEWVNLGAGTDTSDMKNTYSPVKVAVAGTPVDSGELFVGLFMGDHSKTGIGSVFNTGTVVGACCNVFGAGYPPKYVPSFVWGGTSGFEEHDLTKAIETAGRVMGRRSRSLGPEAESVLRKVFELTADERESFLR
jgi:UDP-N-acetylglucosamine diphosphorylase/glucosamine-1-phosphate N-acetyltransferase